MMKTLLLKIASSLCLTIFYGSAVAQYAYFSGQEQDAKRYRWLAQTVSQGGTHGKDCDKNMPTLPWVTYEDTGAPVYKNPHDPAQPWYYSPRFQESMADPKQLATANNDTRLIALRYPFPKLKGQVHGFDADGKRTGALVLNADLLNISIHHQGACVQAQYSTGTPADRAERDRYHRYAKAVQALFQGGAYTAPGGAPEYAALSKTVIFSNDPLDEPHIPKAQPAPADITAKLNARLKAKLARDLDRERLSLQQQIALLKSPAGLAQVANRTVDGRAPTAAENKEKTAHVSSVYQLTLDALPTNIDVVLAACPALQYALDAQGSRMLYLLQCSGSLFGFYEQSSSGDMLLVKIADRRTAQQKKAGMDAHPFVNGLAKFHLQSWTEPYASAWRERWLVNQDPATRRTTANLVAAKYVKGKVQDGDGTDFYVKLAGVFDSPCATCPWLRSTYPARVTTKPLSS
jgi:hypothetical protein